jgi:hypothetical protein
MSELRKALEEPVLVRTKCVYCDWLLSLDADDRAAVIEFYESKLTTSDLMRRLQPFGLPVTHHPLTEHRRGKHSDRL